MFIRVTNAAAEYAGDPILINIHEIVSVYEEHVVGGSLSTKIYSKQGMTWTVEESLSKVQALLSIASIGSFTPK